MKTEGEADSPTLKLPLLLIQTMNHQSSLDSTNHLNNYELALTPPTVSIPFKWEQEPGKPILSPTEITKPPSPLTLELPPRLQHLDSKVTKLPSPDGKITVGEIVRSERRKLGMFGSWGGGCGHKELDGGSFVFPSDYGGGGDEETVFKRVKRVKRNPSFSNLREIKSHFWVSVYEGLKQVMPWRSKKLNKQGVRV